MQQRPGRRVRLHNALSKPDRPYAQPAIGASVLREAEAAPHGILDNGYGKLA
jgi:hypothetical protein